MEGKFVPWGQPPTLDGMTGHAGEFPNCRCYPEPVVHEAGKVVAPPLPTQAQEIEQDERKRLSHWERTGFNGVTPHVDGEHLHNVDKAVFVSKKLTNYSMDPTHPKGKDKARAWKKHLDIDKSHAKDVERQVMAVITKIPARRKNSDIWGERFETLVPVTGPNGRTVDATVAWIYRRDRNDPNKLNVHPELTNCYIETKKVKEG